MNIRSHAVGVSGTALIYVEAGPPDGRAIVLSHSLFMWCEMMYPLMELLATRGYRVIAYDHRGQGSSYMRSLGQMAEPNLSVLTSDAVELIEKLGLCKPHFVGNGLGGMVGLRLAAWCPQRVATVTTLAAPVDVEGFRADLEMLADHVDQYGMKGHIDTAAGPIPVVDLLCQYMFGAWTVQNNPALVGSWRAKFSELVNIGSAIRTVLGSDSVIWDLLRGCEVPVLAVTGDEDRLILPSSGKVIAEASGGRYATVERAGHSLALEQPDAVLSLLGTQFALTD